MRSHLGEPAHLVGQAHLHMYSSLDRDILTAILKVDVSSLMIIFRYSLFLKKQILTCTLKTFTLRVKALVILSICFQKLLGKLLLNQKM